MDDLAKDIAKVFLAPIEAIARWIVMGCDDEDEGPICRVHSLHANLTRDLDSEGDELEEMKGVVPWRPTGPRVPHDVPLSERMRTRSPLLAFSETDPFHWVGSGPGEPVELAPTPQTQTAVQAPTASANSATTGSTARIGFPIPNYWSSSRDTTILGYPCRCPCNPAFPIGRIEVDASCQGLPMWIMPETGAPFSLGVFSNLSYRADGFAVGGQMYKIPDFFCVTLRCAPPVVMVDYCLAGSPCDIMADVWETLTRGHLPAGADEVKWNEFGGARTPPVGPPPGTVDGARGWQGRPTVMRFR